MSVKEELINPKGAKSRYDDGIFFWHYNELLQGILSSHGDNVSFGQELSGSRRILLTILERNLPLVRRKHKHFDI